MSDNWLILIPEDPQLVPDANRQVRAKDRLALIAPQSDEIQIILHDRIEFFDCGASYERIECRNCGAELSLDWWNSRMLEDYDHGFKLNSYSTPCCQASSTFNDLRYIWPQGFGRFGLSARNSNMARLDARHLQEISRILGVELRVIYRHL